jgi:beta-mannosidase
VRGRWKPLQYYSARYFAPVVLYADYKNGSVDFSLSCHRRLDFVGTLEYRIADASNYTIYKNTLDIEVSSMTAEKIHTAELGDYISGHEREYYLEYLIKEGDYVVSRDTLLFVPEKHFAFKKPSFKTVITGQDRRFSITIASDVFVKDMEIDFDGIDAVLEDNYFDMTSDAPIKINITVTGGMETAYRLKDALEVRCVYDLK